MTTRKRYHTNGLTWRAWDQVLRELQERRDRVPPPHVVGGDYERLTRLIETLRAEWTVEPY